MQDNKLFIAIALIIFIIGLTATNNYLRNDYASTRQRLGNPETSQTTESNENDEDDIVLLNSDLNQRQLRAKDLVEDFMNQVEKSSPPNLDPVATELAVNMLTNDALKIIEESPSETAGLARLVGIQDLPDEGITFIEITENEDVIRVITRFKYSGGDLTKTFAIQEIDGEFKIDGIN